MFFHHLFAVFLAQEGGYWKTLAWKCAIIEQPPLGNNGLFEGEVHDPDSEPLYIIEEFLPTEHFQGAFYFYFKLGLYCYS